MEVIPIIDVDWVAGYGRYIQVLTFTKAGPAVSKACYRCYSSSKKNQSAPIVALMTTALNRRWEVSIDNEQVGKTYDVFSQSLA